MGWVWDREKRLYRNTETGETVTQAELDDLRDDLIDAQSAKVRELARSVAERRMTPDGFGVALGGLLVTAFAAQAMLGRGGKAQMGDGARTAVGRQLDDQQTYLDRWVDQLKEARAAPEGTAAPPGTFTEDGIAARAALYLEASKTAYEQGKAAAAGLDESDLPTWPGSGDTRCLSNCRCAWVLEATDGGVNAYWTLDPSAESCIDCESYAEEWNPLFVPTSDGEKGLRRLHALLARHRERRAG